jgi:hypothetical protein
MHKFDLRPVTGGAELSSGPLEVPMIFSTTDREQRAIHLIGFSQKYYVCGLTDD